MRDFIAGFKCVIAGISLLTKPGIRLYVLIPLLINALLFAGVILYGAHLLNDFFNTWLTGWLEWLRWLLWPLFMIVAMTVIFFCFSIIANLVAAPFNGFLAAAAETYITGSAPPDSGGLGQLPTEIKNAVKSEFKKFFYFIIRAIPLLGLFLIPGVQFAAPFLWVLFGAWMLALEYMDFPMGNHGIIFPEIRQMMVENRRLAFGFGIGVMLLTLLPVINFMAIPAAVCGASKMWVDKIEKA